MEYLLKRNFFKKTDKIQLILQFCTLISFLIIGIFLLYGFKKGIFSSSETLEKYIISLGLLAPIVCIMIQAIQVVIPILPGAIGCVVSVILFGPIWGFIINYLGISVGSIVAFLLSRKYGIKLIKDIFGIKTFNKYTSWLEKGKLFDIFFAIAIFAPIAPDDFLCYLAGLTKMSIKKFAVIIVLCKPFSILLYSIGLTALFHLFIV